jgi:hypothetical protein
MRTLGGWIRFAWRFELALYKSLARFVARRPDVPAGATPASYVGAVSVLLWAIVIGSAVELVALHVALPWERVRLAADVLGVWGLMWALGFTASNHVYPHLVTETGIRLRNGHHVSVEVPWDAVERVGTRERSVGGSRALHHDGRVVSVAVGGRTNVDVALSRPLQVPVRGATETVTEVRFFADDPRAVARQAGRRLSGRSGGSR